jgi:coenzyme F420-reducing hydrogenase gamma subunit
VGSMPHSGQNPCFGSLSGCNAKCDTNAWKWTDPPQLRCQRLRWMRNPQRRVAPGRF